jgi:hypothetical protein
VPVERGRFTIHSDPPNSFPISGRGASFDGVGLAEELRDAIEWLLATRPDDAELRERARATFDRACQQLDGVDGTEAVVAALGRPLASSDELVSAPWRVSRTSRY